MTTAFVFPGQGSQSIGMLKDLAARHPQIQRTFAKASAALDMDVWQLVQEGPERALGMTENTQPVMLTAGYAVWQAWRAAGGTLPASMAGHSLGEYTALVSAGALRFEEAVCLVRDRGRYMQEAVPPGSGGMAAILGLDEDQVRQACQQAAGEEVVEPVNFNAPGQVAIAGHRTAVERAVEAAKTLGARRAIPLALSVPAHSSLMRPAAERLEKRLNEVSIQTPQVPVIHNFHVQAEVAPDQIRRRLIEQLDAPVRWVETIELMARQGICRFVECGPNAVLSGLIKRINKDAELTISLDNPERFDLALQACA